MHSFLESCVLEAPPHMVTFEDAYKSYLLQEAALESAKSGAPVDLIY